MIFLKVVKTVIWMPRLITYGSKVIILSGFHDITVVFLCQCENNGWWCKTQCYNIFVIGFITSRRSGVSWKIAFRIDVRYQKSRSGSTGTWRRTCTKRTKGWGRSTTLWRGTALTSRESMASFMMGTQPLNVATWKSAMYAFPTWSKVMRELTHSVLFSARQVTTSGTISALTFSPVIVSRHYGYGYSYRRIRYSLTIGSL